MEKLSAQQREKIFEEELHTLETKNYITSTQHDAVLASYKRYQDDEKAKQVIKIETTSQIEEKEPEKEELIVKAKEPKTPEQIRERNITAVLVTGVILLLFGGLILATSSWGSLGDGAKVFFISLIVVVFFAMSVLSYKLKISQTAFAFLTLASLFIPITIVSAAYYELFGSYFSLYGEGRWFLGLLIGLVLFFLYKRIAERFQSKIFTVLSLIMFTMAIITGLIYVTPNAESFFVALVLVNILLTFMSEKIKERKAFAVFKENANSFLKIKITAEAFVILCLYHHSALYATALLLLSILFLMMFLKGWHFLYHIGFSLSFVWGYVLFINTTILTEINSIAISMLPLFFIVLYIFLKRNAVLARNFQYSFVGLTLSALFYIHVSEFSLQPSVEYLCSLALLTLQQFFVTLYMKNNLFSISTLTLFVFFIFRSTEGLDLSHLMKDWITFCIAAALYICCFLYSKKQWEVFQLGGVIVPVLTGLFVLSDMLARLEWESLVVAFMLLTLIFFLTFKKEKDRSLSLYGVPISLLLSLLCFLGIVNTDTYMESVGASGHFALCALVMVSMAFIIKKGNLSPFFKPFFIVAHNSYAVALFTLLYEWFILQDSTPTLIFLGGILLYMLTLRTFKLRYLWLPLTLSSLFTYLSLLNIFQWQTAQSYASFLLTGGVLFLALSYAVKKYSTYGHFVVFWMSHCVTSLSLFFTILFDALTTIDSYLYILPIICYAVSAFYSEKLWQKYLFTFFGLSTVCISLLSVVEEISNPDFYDAHGFSLTALLAALLWLKTKGPWKAIFEHYCFGILTLSILVYLGETAGVVDFKNFLVVVSLISFMIYLLNKRHLYIQIIFPLFCGTVFYMRFIFSSTAIVGMAVSLLLILLMLIFNYRWKEEEKISIKVLPYQMFGFLYIIVLNVRIFSSPESFWAQFLASIFVPLYIFALSIQYKLTKVEKGYRALIIATAFYPYSVVLNHIDIPALIELEVYAVPIIVIWTFIFRMLFPPSHSMGLIEIGSVCIFFLVLIIDALNSNTVNDAILLGALAVLSAIIGFILKFKSYFLGGIGTILLNIYLQTDSLWGNLPWWLYLILGGGFLITVASFFEWLKQKDQTTSQEILKRNKDRIKTWFKKWS